MAIFSSKNNYVCGAYFKGDSFLVLEFDNRKGKKTVRTKGEIEVAEFIDEEFGVKDKVGLVQAAKRIRKNTKSYSIYINKSFNQKDLTHFFEVFSVAGFERVKFVDIKDTLNTAFRREMIEGQELFLVFDNEYKLFVSNKDGVELFSTAKSIGDIDLDKQKIQDAVGNLNNENIYVFGLQKYEDFESLEEILHEGGFKAILGNIWQNAFSVQDHIPSIHFKQSSRFSLPVALALYSDQDDENIPTKKESSRSLSEELDKKLDREIFEKDKEIRIKQSRLQPTFVDEKILAHENKDKLNTEIDLPIFSRASKKDSGLASYIPEFDASFKESWEVFDFKQKEESTILNDDIKEIEEDDLSQTDKEKVSEQTKNEKNYQDVFVEASKKEEDSINAEDIVEVYEEKEERQIDVEIIEGSKEISENKVEEEKEVVAKKRSFFATLFKQRDSDSVPKDIKKKKKRKKKSKNARKHKKNKK